MPRRRRGLHDVRADRPKTPYLPDGTLDPREWEIACSAANVIGLVVLPAEPWFVEARPVHVQGKGVELEVVVRWLSPEVWDRVPAAVDGYPCEIALEGASDRAQIVH